MITESIAILAIMLCLIVVFIRAQQSDYALGVTPLLLVPFIHLFAVAVFYLGRVPFFGFAPKVAVAFADIAAAAVSGAFIFSFSQHIKKSRNRKLYIALMCGYNAVLACTYVYRILAPLLLYE